MSWYGRWCDEDGVVHWVESRHNNRWLTSCSRQVAFVDKTAYIHTAAMVTCIRCIVEADEDVVLHAEPTGGTASPRP